MPIRRWRLTRLGNALAFVWTIGIGIVAEYVLSEGESVEEQLIAKKRHAEKQTPRQK